MSRSGSPSEFNQTEFRPFFAVELLFDEVTNRFWTGYGSITIDGNEYVGNGKFLSLSGVEEDMQISAKGLSIVMSGLPTDFMSLALNAEYQYRKANIYTGAIQSDGTVQSYLMFSGFMNQMNFAENHDDMTITISVENRLIDLERPREMRYTDEDQRARYPDRFNENGIALDEDIGLSLIVDIQDREIVWK